MPGSVLIIDDEEQLRKLLTRIIKLEGFTVEDVNSLKSAQAILRSRSFDVVLCDVKLPDGNGVEFVKVLKDAYPSIEIILLTAYGNISDGVKAIKNGAFDYITKGDDNDRIIPLVYQAMDRSILRKESSIKISDKADYDFGAIIGNSLQTRKAIELAGKISASDATVLLLGETGTGKEVFANAIHSNSKRRANAMVAINCSALNKELLEGELFGYRAGAYTGALKDKKGLIEVAEGGTLFLDEIGELQFELQAKLLRFLENGEYIKLGDTKVSRANVRVIAATNRDLSKEVNDGHFREDLYYRLNVFTIELSPLRERAADIPMLITHLLSGLAKTNQVNPVKVSEEALKLLVKYNWKGNVRELKNVLSRAMILMDGPEIKPAHLPFQIQQQDDQTGNTLSLSAVEKSHIQKILHHTGGNKTKAARLLEIGLATLYRKMQEYAID